MNITIKEHNEIVEQAAKVDAALEASMLPAVQYLVIKIALLFLKLFAYGMLNAGRH